MFTATKEFRFESAHLLCDHPSKCRNLHGHNYSVLVEMKSKYPDEMGMVKDFYDIKKFADSLFDEFDHSFIYNEATTDLFEKELYELLKKYSKKIRIFPYRATAEHMAMYFYYHLNDKLEQQLKEENDPHKVWISKVTVYETPTSFSTFTEKDGTEYNRKVDKETGNMKIKL